MDEFIIGCMQLQGSAKVLDIETLLRNHKKLFGKVAAKIEGLETLIQASMTDMKSYMLKLFTSCLPTTKTI